MSQNQTRTQTMKFVSSILIGAVIAFGMQGVFEQLAPACAETCVVLVRNPWVFLGGEAGKRSVNAYAVAKKS